MSYFTTKEKYNFMIIGVFIAAIINLIIFISSYNRYLSIIADNYFCKAKVKGLEQNNFGTEPSYKFLFEYKFEDKTYSNFKGIYKHDEFNVGDEVEIIFQKSNPNNFMIIQGINHWYIFMIFLVLFIVLIMLIVFKQKIISLIEKNKI